MPYRNKRENDIIDSLRQELGNAKDTEESTAEEGMKYQTSNLTDGQMQTIADAIGNVMENTTEFCDCNFSQQACRPCGV